MMRVDRVLDTVLGDDRGRADLTDARGDHVHVGPGQRPVVVVGDHDPLAADPVGRRQLCAQVGVADMASQPQAHQRLETPHACRLVEQERKALAAHVLTRARETLERGEPPVERPLDSGDAAVHPRKGPGGGPLEDKQPAHPWLDFRDQLGRRATGTDYGDPLAGEVVVVVPAGRVKAGAGKALDAGDVRQCRMAERSHPGDQDLGLDFAGGRLDRPELARLVPGGAGHLVSEADARGDVVFVCAAADVGPDLLLGRVDMAPIRVRRE